MSKTYYNKVKINLNDFIDILKININLEDNNYELENIKKYWNEHNPNNEEVA